jgi:hypothetical protein
MMLVDPSALKLRVLQQVINIGWRGDVYALLVDAVETTDHAIMRKCHFSCYGDRFVDF